ncbi:alpha/beta hydrolase [Micromonospora sp. NPDC048843]|uniref:esterase/lipase family protein n=1 Tax=Micromonospora sp. NPDC048843 TaxID=3155389 RepID=UPI0033C0456E
MIDADLVLIHGFWSSPATWDQVAERVQADLDLRGLRVHRFRYESPKLPMPFAATRIPDYNDVAQSLRSYLAATVSRRDTAIVTHSQGGLILQRFLAWMLNEGYGQELASVKLVLMLACPNEGSEFSRSIRKMAGFGRHAQARDLQVLSSDVTDARRTVLRQVVYADTVSARECRIPFRVYAGRSDRIVTRASAQSVFPEAETLPGDHSSILHAAQADNLTFPTLKRHLVETFGQRPAIIVAGNGAVAPPSPDSTEPVNGENVVVRWNPDSRTVDFITTPDVALSWIRELREEQPDE